MILLPLWGEDYRIGYRLMTHNASVQYENLTISKSMTPCGGTPQTPLVLDRLPHETLEQLLRRHEDEFLAYAADQPFALKSHHTSTPSFQISKESLTLPTQCYAVEFNDESATIALRK